MLPLKCLRSKCRYNHKKCGAEHNPGDFHLFSSLNLFAKTKSKTAYPVTINSQYLHWVYLVKQNLKKQAAHPEK
jgi:hypothetical protein